MEQSTHSRTKTAAGVSTCVSAWVTASHSEARDLDFLAGPLANPYAVGFRFAVRNTYCVVAGFLLGNAFPGSAADRLGSLFAAELSYAAFAGAGFALPFSNAAVTGSLFAAELGNAAVTGSCFALPLSYAAGPGSLLRLAYGNAVSVGLFNTLELGNANRYFTALDFRNPNSSADGSAAGSTSAVIAGVSMGFAIFITGICVRFITGICVRIATIGSVTSASRFSSTAVACTCTATTAEHSTEQATTTSVAKSTQHTTQGWNLNFTGFPVTADASNFSHHGFLVRNANGTGTGSLLFVGNHDGVFLGHLLGVGNTDLVGLLNVFPVGNPNRIFLLNRFRIGNANSVGFLNFFGVRYSYGVLYFLLGGDRNSLGNVIRSCAGFFLVLRHLTSTLFGCPLRDPYFASDVGRTTTAIGRCGAWRS